MRLTIIAFALAVALAGCGTDKPRGADVWGNDPKNAESIYEYEEKYGVQTTSVWGADSSRYVCASAISGISSEHHRLYSPNGNLRLILGGASEMGGAYGWRIDYGADGKVEAVCDIGVLADAEYERLSEGGEDALAVMREKLASRDVHMRYGVERGSGGAILRVGDVYVPGGYKAEIFIREWGPFWKSDIDGGCFGFFVRLVNTEKDDANRADLLYCNNRLIAETAYKGGKPHKVRTYNRRGQLVGVRGCSSGNVADMAFYDRDIVPQWGGE